MNLIKYRLIQITSSFLFIVSLCILLSIQSTLFKKLSVYDVDSKGIFKFQGIEVSYKDTFSKQLASAILMALRHLSLKYIDVDVEPYSPEFSRLDESQAKALIQGMQKVFTVSHEQAWEIKLDNTSYAIKVYYSKETQWEIAIVSIGFQHYIDALCFSLKLPGYEYINLNNALDLLKKNIQNSDIRGLNFRSKTL